MTGQEHIDAEMGRQLDHITQENGCLHAVLFTGDGLLKAKSSGIDRADAERAAAGLTGIGSLSRGLVDFCGTDELTWRRTIVDFGDHTVMVLTAAANTYLAVSVTAGLTSDQIVVVTHTAVGVIKAMNEYLGAPERTRGPGPHSPSAYERV